jgi:hypothetical protein
VLACWYFVRVTASDPKGGYWADASKVTVTPTGYATNSDGSLSAIFALTNTGPYTFSFWASVETHNGPGWIGYPPSDPQHPVVYPVFGTSLLAPGGSATISIPVPPIHVGWRASIQLRDLHGTNFVATLTRLWEDYIKKDDKSDVIYTDEQSANNALQPTATAPSVLTGP